MSNINIIKHSRITVEYKGNKITIKEDNLDNFNRAIELKEKGLSYKDIASYLNLYPSTIYKWLDYKRYIAEKNRKHNLSKEQKEKYLEYKRQYSKKRKNNLDLRIKDALVAMYKFSIKNGYTPCITSIEEIKKRFTGQCDICGIQESECSKRLNIDHDHNSGYFRGWLCNLCNTQLLVGAKDSIDILYKAINYLESSEAKNV